MNLFRPFTIKAICGKLWDTMKLMRKLLTFRDTRELEAEINRIRAKWGLPPVD